MAFDYDEIGYWSEIKLDIIKKYASAYSVIMSKQQFIKKHIYIDAFAGAGKHISKAKGRFVKGSPLNALDIDPPFSEFHLIDLHRGKTAWLQMEIGPRNDVYIYNEDANKILPTIFQRCKRDDYNRGLCLLDPYALNVDWSILKTAGEMQSIEIFYNFMIMDANMNIRWKNPEKVSPEQLERMDKAWGDRSWHKAAYIQKTTLWGDTVDEKFSGSNEAVAEAFRQRLKEVAGFNYVPKPVPMRNERGATIYYLFFASPNKTGSKIVEDIFNSYRNKGAL